MYKFDKRLKELRNERDLSLEELALAIGTTKSTLSKYERGLMSPSLDVAKQLSEFFGVSLDYIAGSSDDRKQIIPAEYERVIKRCIEEKVPVAKIEQFIDIMK